MDQPFLKTHELRALIRDYTTLTGAQRILLDELADLAIPKRRYCCKPSMALLVQRTHYSEQRIRIAANALEEAGFIKREVRHVRGKDGKPRKQTRYGLNVPALRALEAKALAERAAVDDDDEGWDPFGLDTADGEGAMAPCETYEDIVLYMLQKMWPNHGGFSDPDAPELRGRLERCIAKAGSAGRFGDVLEWVYLNDPQACAAIEAAATPAAYIGEHLPEWLNKFDSQADSEENEVFSE